MDKRRVDYLRMAYGPVEVRRKPPTAEQMTEPKPQTEAVPATVPTIPEPPKLDATKLSAGQYRELLHLRGIGGADDLIREPRPEAPIDPALAALQTRLAAEAAARRAAIAERLAEPFDARTAPPQAVAERLRQLGMGDTLASAPAPLREVGKPLAPRTSSQHVAMARREDAERELAEAVAKGPRLDARSLSGPAFEALVRARRLGGASWVIGTRGED